jgi:two-component system, response regulator RegA
VAARVLTILVVDDDQSVLASYRRGLELQSRRVLVATTNAEAHALAAREQVGAAIVDLRIGQDSGIELASHLKSLDPSMVVVVVSGYLSVTSAVAAVRSGADHVMPKPVTCGELLRRIDEPTAVSDDDGETPTLARAEWEHMMRVLSDCDGNISKAARRLGLHRQNLQRRLRKLAPPH